MELNLNLKDRIIILNNVLPQYDSRQNIALKQSVTNAIRLSDQENSEIVYAPAGNNQYDVSFKTINAMTKSDVFTFTNEEIEYMKQRVEFIDRNGMFSAETMDTYNKILDAISDESPSDEQAE